MKTNIQNNKSLLTRAVLCLVLFCSSYIALSAHMPGTVAPSSSETEKTIKKYFRFPQILVGPQEIPVVSNTVEVLFTTDNKGNVNFVLAKTKNEALRHEIERQFYKLNLPKLKQDVVNSVVLNFRSL